MNAETAPLALGGYAFAIAGAILGIWLTVALLRAVFRIRDATEETARLLRSTALAAGSPPAQIPFDQQASAVDMKTSEEYQAWKDGRIKTKVDLAAFREKKPIAGA